MEQRKKYPPRIVALSFLALILIGWLLLLLPWSSKEGSLTILEAFFTATSAVCVTGLSVIELSQLSLLGQTIVMILIQFGGIGFMVISYFLVLTIRGNLSLSDDTVMEMIVSKDDYGSLNKGVRLIVTYTFVIEALVFIFILISTPVHTTRANHIWNSLFLSISSFCNAGFTLSHRSLQSYISNVPFNLVIMTAIILGALGFPVINDLLQWIKSKWSKKNYKLNINTLLVLRGTIILLLLSSLLIYVSERENILQFMNPKEKMIATFFQAVTLRTAGFSTIPFSQLRRATLLILIPFMFIGGGAGGTAGGIKINTAALLLRKIINLAKGSKRLIIGNFEVGKDQIIKCFILFFMGIICLYTASFLLILFEPASEFINLIFESVSAYGTVGLSTGITSQLNWQGQVILIPLMIMGRIGSLTLVTALSTPKDKSMIEYPGTTFNIG